MYIASCFYPFSDKFHSMEAFKQLTGWEKFKTITVTALAAFATLPFFGLGGIAAFRAMVRRYTIINPEESSDQQSHRTASKTNQVANNVMNKQPSSDNGRTDSVYINLVKEKIGKEEAKSELTDLHETFMKQCKQAEQKALELHVTFKEKFQSESLPEMDQKGRSISTLAQFKFAQSLFKKEFPKLSSLPFNNEQKCAVARLMQIIMCGQQEQPLPGSFHCFLIREVEEKSADTSLEETDGYLTKILAEVTLDNTKDHLKNNFLESVSYFVNDCVARPMNSFEISDQRRVELGPKSEDSAKLALFIKEQLFEEFQASPEKVSAMVEEAKAEGSFAALLKEWFPDEHAAGELLSEDCFKKIFEGSRNQHSVDQVKQTLDQFTINCRLDADAVQELAGASKCTVEEIQSLVRVRFLQMVVLMNQAQQKDSFEALQKLLLPYGKNEMTLHPQAVSSVFSAAPGNFLQDFSTTLDFSVFVIEGDFEQEGIVEYFEDYLSLAMVTTQDAIESFTSGKAKRQIKAMKNLCVSWQIPEAILDHLVSQIDVEAGNNQPSQR